MDFFPPPELLLVSIKRWLRPKGWVKRIVCQLHFNFKKGEGEVIETEQKRVEKNSTLEVFVGMIKLA